MKRAVIIVAALALASCAQASPEERAARGQRNLDDLVVACRDGVQYLVSPWGGSHSYVAAPHLKPDGKPYTCEVKK